MKIKREIPLRYLRKIQLGTHYGLPAARVLVGSAVKAVHLGFGAEKRAWRSYSKYMGGVDGR